MQPSAQTAALLEQGEEESLRLARQRVNEQVAQYLASVQLPAAAPDLHLRRAAGGQRSDPQSRAAGGPRD